MVKGAKHASSRYKPDDQWFRRTLLARSFIWATLITMAFIRRSHLPLSSFVILSSPDVSLYKTNPLDCINNAYVITVDQNRGKEEAVYAIPRFLRNDR